MVISAIGLEWCLAIILYFSTPLIPPFSYETISSLLKISKNSSLILTQSKCPVLITFLKNFHKLPGHHLTHPCPHVIYRSSCSLPSICILSPSLYTIHYPSSLLKEIALKMSFPSSTIKHSFPTRSFLLAIISPSYRKKQQINFFSTSLSATALSSFLHKITSTSVYHDSCSLRFIIKYWFNY